MLRGIEAGDILPLIASGKLRIEELGLSFEDILSLIVGSEAEGEAKKEGVKESKAELMQVLAAAPALGGVLAEKEHSTEEGQKVGDEEAVKGGAQAPAQREETPEYTKPILISEASSQPELNKLSTKGNPTFEGNKGTDYNDIPSAHPKPLTDADGDTKSLYWVRAEREYLLLSDNTVKARSVPQTDRLMGKIGETPHQASAWKYEVGLKKEEPSNKDFTQDKESHKPSQEDRIKAYYRTEQDSFIKNRKVQKIETSPEIERAGFPDKGAGVRTLHLKEINHYSSHEAESEGSYPNLHNPTIDSPEKSQELVLKERIPRIAIRTESKEGLKTTEENTAHGSKVPRAEESTGDNQIGVEVHKGKEESGSDRGLKQKPLEELQQPKREETREIKHAPERRDNHQERQGVFSQSVSEPKEEVKEVHHTLRRDVPLQNRGEVRSVNVRFEDTHLRFRFQSESLNVEIRLREDIQRQMGYLDVQRLSRNLESLGLSLEGLRINGVELLSRSQRHREKERFNIRERDGAGEKASDSLSDSPDIQLLL